MNNKDMILAHGEKVVVAVAFILCFWSLLSVYTNPDVRPKDISMAKINELVQKVENVRNTAPPRN
jgi:hypothetical protein